MSFTFEIIKEGLKFKLEQTGECVCIKEFNTLRVNRDGTATVDNKPLDGKFEFPENHHEVALRASALITINMGSTLLFINAKSIAMFYTKNLETNPDESTKFPTAKWQFFVECKKSSENFFVTTEEEKNDFVRVLETVMAM